MVVDLKPAVQKLTDEFKLEVSMNEVAERLQVQAATYPPLTQIVSHLSARLAHKNKVEMVYGNLLLAGKVTFSELPSWLQTKWSRKLENAPTAARPSPIVGLAPPQQEDELRGELQKKAVQEKFAATATARAAHQEALNLTVLSASNAITPKATPDVAHPESFEELLSEVRSHVEAGGRDKTQLVLKLQRALSLSAPSSVLDQLIVKMKCEADVMRGMTEQLSQEVSQLEPEPQDSTLRERESVLLDLQTRYCEDEVRTAGWLREAKSEGDRLTDNWKLLKNEVASLMRGTGDGSVEKMEGILVLLRTRIKAEAQGASNEVMRDEAILLGRRVEESRRLGERVAAQTQELHRFHYDYQNNQRDMKHLLTSCQSLSADRSDEMLALSSRVAQISSRLTLTQIPLSALLNTGLVTHSQPTSLAAWRFSGCIAAGLLSPARTACDLLFRANDAVAVSVLNNVSSLPLRDLDRGLETMREEYDLVVKKRDRLHGATAPLLAQVDSGAKQVLKLLYDVKAASAERLTLQASLAAPWVKVDNLNLAAWLHTYDSALARLRSSRVATR